MPDEQAMPRAGLSLAIIPLFIYSCIRADWTWGCWKEGCVTLTALGLPDGLCLFWGCTLDRLALLGTVEGKLRLSDRGATGIGCTCSTPELLVEEPLALLELLTVLLTLVDGLEALEATMVSIPSTLRFRVFCTLMRLLMDLILACCWTPSGGRDRLAGFGAS